MSTNSFDLVLTDPPYGKKADRGTNGFGAAKSRKYTSEWDSVTPSKEVFDEILRVGKHVMIFGGNYFAHVLPASKCWLVWDKKGDIKFKNPFADCELIYTSFTKPVKRYVFRQQGFVTDSRDERYHPTQKPTELVEQLLADWTLDGASVLDPFMGSGTTAVACQRLKRPFVGIELDDDYYTIAKERVGEREAMDHLFE